MNYPGMNFTLVTAADAVKTACGYDVNLVTSVYKLGARFLELSPLAPAVLSRLKQAPQIGI